MITQSQQFPDLSRMSFDERLALLEAVWDSLLADQRPIPLTPAQEEEIARRLDQYAGNREASISWEEVKRTWRTNNEARD